MFSIRKCLYFICVLFWFQIAKEREKTLQKRSQDNRCGERKAAGFSLTLYRPRADDTRDR